MRRVAAAGIGVRRTWVAWILAGVAGCAHDPAPQGAEAALRQRSARLEPVQVEGIEEPLLRGFLTVPENPAEPSGRTLALQVVVVPALEPEPGAVPLFFLEGGPGVPATDSAGLFVHELAELRRKRDVVLVDQRGTGGSGALHCAALAPADDLQARLDEMYPAEHVMACRDELAQRADLTCYTTNHAADDLDAVRVWLGHERIHLFGLSYGTRLALVYLRRHPERAASAVLLGATPLDHAIPARHAIDAERALELVLEDCAAAPRCAAAFPDVRRELDELLARLEREPARVSFPHPSTGAPEPLVVRRFAFAEGLRTQLYSSAGAREVPFLIHAAARGDFAPFLRAVLPQELPEPPWLSEGLYLSIVCAEDTRFVDPARAAELCAGTFLGTYRLDQQLRATSLWPLAELPPGYRAPVVSDAPVLIVSGRLDPVTPPELGAALLATLPNARQLVVPALAHVPAGLSNLACLERILCEFFARGSAHELDPACLAEMRPPPFRTE